MTHQTVSVFNAEQDSNLEARAKNNPHDIKQTDQNLLLVCTVHLKLKSHPFETFRVTETFFFFRTAGATSDFFCHTIEKLVAL